MSRQKQNLTIRAVVTAAVTLLLGACSEIQRPQPEPYYSETVPPAKQELRWSNGKMPQSFDPARAAAAPETDLVRALFEGLTEVDTRTLDAVPAAAEKWSASDDRRVWTFQLRKNARWSNGKRVTAYDFVTSWKRLIALGERTAHRELFQNIVGFQAVKPIPATEPTEPVLSPVLPIENPTPIPPANTAPPQQPNPQPEATVVPKKPEAKPEEKLGVAAVDDLTLKVTLKAPDQDLPKLVAAPIFRPIYGDGSEFVDGLLDNSVVTNGAFKVTVVDRNGVSLERSETYWNKAAVKLDRVRLVVKDSAEAALDAYKKGDIDAVTNAIFQPLALKLLAPYDDFRQTTYSAVNLYKFDETRPPFTDRRVREALALATDREHLANVELDGAAEPANSFLAANDESLQKLAFDPPKAKKLLETAGFPNGEGFAPIKLLINRNDTQMRVARAVARMWKQNLNIETEITAKELSEIEAAETAHEFDIVRHGFVLPSADEAVSMWSIFEATKPAITVPREVPDGQPREETEKGGPSASIAEPPAEKLPPTVITEEDALYELHAIPLYFPKSYALVKPYVHGFEINGLDAVYLPGVSINSNWQPKAQGRES
jgi:ABC-type oligopeptide transport system substrate-binding subunit